MSEKMPLSEVVKAFLLSLLDTGNKPAEIRAAFKECGFVSDPARNQTSADPILPFHEWKARQRKSDAPVVHPSDWYYTAYGRYVDKARRAGAAAKTTCNPHPEAPHGFNRNASHNAGRYVCDCEGWLPPDWKARMDDAMGADVAPKP